MLHKILKAVGITAVRKPPYAPYKQKATDFVYNLLFCDDPKMFAASQDIPGDWREVLFIPQPSPPDVAALAESEVNEGRARMLAYNWLRQNGYAVPKGRLSKQLLGIIIEVSFPDGVDALAVFSDGGIRYINKTGKIVFIEGIPAAEFAPIVERLFATAHNLVARMGPWDKPRLPPPENGKTRMTFLVSDGFYFCEGPMAALQRERFAGPVIAGATELLLKVVDKATK